MSILQIRLLGEFELSLGEQALPPPATVKARSLLAYLVTHCGRAHRREELANLFWPEHPRERALHSLSTAIWHIRRALPAGDFVLTTAQKVRFNPDTTYWLDAEALEQAVTSQLRSATGTPGHPPDPDLLAVAVKLYRGDFLEGFYDDWCWDTVVDRYKDAQNPPRWILERPNDRGSIMPGPDAIPVPDWTATGIIGLESEACAPFATSWIREDGGAALDYDTWVEGASKLYQGKTRSDQPEGVPPTAGVITILGAHHGDAVRVSKSCGWFCSSSGTTTALCPSASGAEQQEATAPEQQAITLERDPFGLEVSTLPQGDGTTLIVEVQASIPLPQAPQVEVWQGAGAVLTPTLAFDGVKYTGQVSLDPQLGLQGQVFARAVDAQSHAVHALDFFSAEPVEPDQLTWVKSADGLMEIFLPAGSLEGEPVVSIQPANRPVWEQGGTMVVGRPYEISSSDGTIGLNQPAVANIYFASDVVETDGSPRLDLYHWDEQSGRWVPLSGTLELTHNFVSAEITELGAYAILRSFEDRQYLPLVVRQYRGP